MHQVVPEEDAVPAGRLGGAGQADQCVGLPEHAELGHVQTEAHRAAQAKAVVEAREGLAWHAIVRAAIRANSCAACAREGPQGATDTGNGTPHGPALERGPGAGAGRRRVGAVSWRRLRRHRGAGPPPGASAAVAAPATARHGAPSPRADTSTAGPLLGEAVREYTTMTATRYQHHDVENAEAGTYYYDCVGFVAYAISQGRRSPTPEICDEYHIAPNRVPAPGVFVHLFATLDGTQTGWEPVSHVADLRPGDVVAWSYDSAVQLERARPRPHLPRRRLRRGEHAAALGNRQLPRPGLGLHRDAARPERHTAHEPEEPARRRGEAVRARHGHGARRRRRRRRDRDRHWSPSSGPAPAAYFGMGRPVS